MGFGGWGKIAMNGDAKIDPEGGQGLARTVQPVERKRERERERERGETAFGQKLSCSSNGASFIFVCRQLF